MEQTVLVWAQPEGREDPFHTRTQPEAPPGFQVLRLLLPTPGGRGRAERGSFRFCHTGDQEPALLEGLRIWLLIDLLRASQEKTWVFPDPQTVQSETEIANRALVLVDLEE